MSDHEAACLEALDVSLARQHAEERIEALERENAVLREALDRYAQHNDGCSGRVGAAYRCRCGWRDTAASLGISEGSAK